MTILELNNISKSYDKDLIFEDVDLCVRNGEIIGIVGENGSGKTTLAEIIAGFQRPDEGRIIFRGEDITKEKPSNISKKGIKIGFQNKKDLRGMKILDVLKCSRESVYPSLNPFSFREKTGLKKYIAELEFFKLYSEKGSYIGNLSGGQKSIVESLKTTISDFDVIILDEPFDGLSEENRDRLEKHLDNKLDTSESLILVDHDLTRLDKLSDRLFKLERNGLEELVDQE